MAKKKVWRPRLYDGKASIEREYKFFAVVCRTVREADMVEKSLVQTLAKARKLQVKK